MKAPKKGGPGGRPPHAPTEASTKQVEAMASYGIPQEDISKVLGITANTLRRHYSATLAVAETKANAVVAQRLFQKTAGDGQSAVTACIFWLKTRAGWKEPPQAHGFVDPSDAGAPLGGLTVRVIGGLPKPEGTP